MFVIKNTKQTITLCEEGACVHVCMCVCVHARVRAFLRACVYKGEASESNQWSGSKKKTSSYQIFSFIVEIIGVTRNSNLEALLKREILCFVSLTNYKGNTYVLWDYPHGIEPNSFFNISKCFNKQVAYSLVCEFACLSCKYMLRGMNYKIKHRIYMT
jgi:hypothetical protein